MGRFRVSPTAPTIATNHSNQQQQTSNNLQIWMYSIQSKSLARNRTRSSSIIFPKIIGSISPSAFASIRGKSESSTSLCCVNTVRKRLPQCQKSTCKNTKCQNSCNWVCSTLMCQNFSRGNILQHYDKLEQNSQSPNINQQLKQYKVFKTNQYQKSGYVKKKLYKVKYAMYWVFRCGHLINTSQCTCSYQSKNCIHFQ